MASILVYTSPARGHLFPVLGASLELRSRGHAVSIRTLSPEVDRVRSLGIVAEPIARAVEDRELDDWRATNPMDALARSMRTFGDRAVHELDDVRDAIEATRADALLVDTNSWGAQAAAEASGLPWATFQPYFTPLPAPGVPPFGPGLPRSRGAAGRVRDALLRRLIFSKMDREAVPAMNGIRARLGLKSVSGIVDQLQRPPRVFYFTAEPLEYPRPVWPESFRLVGPPRWESPEVSPDWLQDISRPIVLVTCSTEMQNDRSIVEAALRCLPRSGYFVVATSAAYRPGEVAAEPTASTRLERYLPHGPIIERAEVVVCHGGMGITQRSLARGVPVVVVPFGRDQPEVARRVEYAGAGVRLLPGRLNDETLGTAVEQARAMRPGAQRIADSFAATGGDIAVADGMEELLAGTRVRRATA